MLTQHRRKKPASNSPPIRILVIYRRARERRCACSYILKMNCSLRREDTLFSFFWGPPKKKGNTLQNPALA